MIFQKKTHCFCLNLSVALLFLLNITPSTNGSDTTSEAQLLRKSYQSTATHTQREYFLYLPQGYEADGDKKWPVILFLHGGGERGNGLEDLDYVLKHGPLAEAWIQRRDLPFIILAPQLPLFEMTDQIRQRTQAKPQRLDSGTPPRNEGNRSPRLFTRESEGAASTWGKDGPPNGWWKTDDDLLGMVDATLRDYRTDANRVYLTGLSYGGFGTWYMAITFPDRWAAIAPICGGADIEQVHHLAEAQTPIWAFQGGKDPLVKPQWIYPIINALQEAAHEQVRFTVHEDLAHNVWTRVYAGDDLYQWFLSKKRN
jgi:predicted peptidase